MKKYKLVIIFLNLVALLFYFNFSVARKETLLKGGRLMLLELAPVDPRSLMQGDYMDLRYQIAAGLDSVKLSRRGYCVVRLDSNGVAQRVRFQKDPTPLSEGEWVIRYSAPDSWSINIGAGSFFFQEGQSEKYMPARYGGLKVDEKGNSLLVGLYDEFRRKIE